MQEVARIKPIVPSASKPWLPWGFSFASTFLILLMIGFGTRALYRFQQPYSLDATSEMTIEFVEAPVVLPLTLKPDVRNQFGNANTLGKNSGAGQQPGPSLDRSLCRPRMQTLPPRNRNGFRRGEQEGFLVLDFFSPLTDPSMLLRKPASTDSHHGQTRGHLLVPSVRIGNSIKLWQNGAIPSISLHRMNF